MFCILCVVYVRRDVNGKKGSLMRDMQGREPGLGPVTEGCRFPSSSVKLGNNSYRNIRLDSTF